VNRKQDYPLPLNDLFEGRFSAFRLAAVCGLINRDRLLSRVTADGLGFDSSFFFDSRWFGNRYCTRFQRLLRLLRRTGHGLMKRLSSREPPAFLAPSRMPAASLLASYFRSLSLPADTLGTWGTKLALSERRHQAISLTTRHTLLGQLLE
jgi:hypothetical protein